ncbi:Dlc90F, partial [Symbiodinium necroappetens]
MDDEGENEFVSEQVNEIVKNAITKTLGGSQYSKERVTSWTNQIIDECLKELAKLNKPFKYAACSHFPLLRA